MKSKQLYFVAGFIQAISGFIVLPFVLNNTSLEQYGKYLLFITISGFIGIFLNLGLHNVISAYYTYWNRKNIIYESIALLLVAMLIQAVFISILLFTLIKIINIAIFSSDFLIIVVLILAFLQTLQLFFQAFFRMNENASEYFISTILFVILDFIFKIYYLTNFEFDLEGFLFVSVAPYIFIYGAFSIYILVKYVSKYELNINLIQIYYRYSLSMFVANLIGRTTSVIDKPLVVYLMGYEVFAIYGLAQKFNNSIGGFRIILKNIWIADAIKNFNTDKLIYANKYILYTISGATLSVILLVPVYVDLFFDQKLDKLFFDLVVPLASLNILWVYYYFYLVAVISKKKSKHMPKVQLFTTIFYLLSLLLVVYLDVYGIVIALYIQMISLILFTRFYYKRFINHNYLMTKELVFILLLVYSIGFFMNHNMIFT